MHHIAQECRFPLITCWIVLIIMSLGCPSLLMATDQKLEENVTELKVHKRTTPIPSTKNSGSRSMHPVPPLNLENMFSTTNRAEFSSRQPSSLQTLFDRSPSCDVLGDGSSDIPLRSPISPSKKRGMVRKLQKTRSFNDREHNGSPSNISSLNSPAKRSFTPRGDSHKKQNNVDHIVRPMENLTLGEQSSTPHKGPNWMSRATHFLKPHARIHLDTNSPHGFQNEPDPINIVRKEFTRIKGIP